MTARVPVQVAVGVIARNGRYLITQRKPGTHLGGLWEFPGGKREGNESLAECLRRECREELGIDITDPISFRSFRHDYPEKSLELHFFRCAIRAGEPRPIACAALKWVTPTELSGFKFPPADQVLVQALQDEIMGNMVWDDCETKAQLKNGS